jgi:hypothetical protein
MRAADVVGRTIVSIAQERTIDTLDNVVYNLLGINLDNGSTVMFWVYDTEQDPGVRTTVHKKGHKRPYWA